MKRIVLFGLVGAAALAGSQVLAGINPLRPGLPENWTMTSTQGYGGIVIAATYTAVTNNGNDGSAMCVECHTVNPSTHVANPSDNAAGYDVTNGAANRGSHTVANALVGGTPVLKGYTHSGGGFSGGFPINTTFRAAREYVFNATWSPSGGMSKYGNPGATTPVASILGRDATGIDPDMICESCHNLLTNVDIVGTAGASNKLLLGDYADANTDATSDDICVGCHAKTTIDYAGFHGNGNFPNFDRTRLKRHHVLEADTMSSARYNPDGNSTTNDSTMWAPNFSNRLGTGSYTSFSADTILSDGATVAFRNKVNVTGVGTRVNAGGTGPNAGQSAVNGDIGTGTNLYCTSCHRPHNAMSSSGAFILRTGNGSDFTNPRAAAGAAAGTLQYGIRRQYDVGSWTTDKLYGEYRNLCDGCHVGY